MFWHHRGTHEGLSRDYPHKFCSVASSAGLISTSPMSSSTSATALGARGSAGTWLCCAATPIISAAWLYLVSAAGSTGGCLAHPGSDLCSLGLPQGSSGAGCTSSLSFPSLSLAETPPPPYLKASCGPSWPDDPQHPSTRLLEFSYNGGDCCGKMGPPHSTTLCHTQQAGGHWAGLKP